MSKQLVNREELGKQLQNQVQRIDDKTYCIKSLTSNKTYEIVSTQLGFVCSCPDHMFRGIKCKHIIATELSLKIREIVKKKIIEPIVNIGKCIFCKSAQIVKDGLRHNKYGDIQKFNCKDCKKYFTINIGFERMKHNPQGITTVHSFWIRFNSFNLKIFFNYMCNCSKTASLGFVNSFAFELVIFIPISIIHFFIITSFVNFLFVSKEYHLLLFDFFDFGIFLITIFKNIPFYKV